MYTCNTCIKLFSITYFAIDSLTVFIFEIKIKVNYIDLNLKLILITEDAEDVKPGHIT